MMVVLGTDAHKRSHTIVAVDEVGVELGVITVGATPKGHLRAAKWATQFGQRRWAIEDCRNMSRHLEGELLAAGEQVVRVPPKLMAGARRSVRTRGKSDPIDALAVARAALREPGLPMARLDGPAREVKLLVDYRGTLIGERTRAQNRLRWMLHELDPQWDPPTGSLDRYCTLDEITRRLATLTGTVAEMAKRITTRISEITREAKQLERELTTLVAAIAPALLALPGCGALTAAKLVGEAADVTRFRDRNAYAMWCGTAPIPASSANNNRYRLNRGGNRQTNAAIHRIAITQLRYHPDAQAFIKRRITNGNTKREAIRALKRQLSNVVYRTMLKDTKQHTQQRAA